MKRLKLLILLVVLLIVGCKEKEPEPEPIQTPTYSSETKATISKYDDVVTYVVNDYSAIQKSSKDEFTVLPDKTKFDSVTVQLLQGGLNAYLSDVIKDGLINESGSNIEYYRKGFKINGVVYGFIYTTTFNTIMATGTSYSDIELVLGNILRNSDIKEYKNYKVNTDSELGFASYEEETTEPPSTEEYSGY